MSGRKSDVPGPDARIFLTGTLNMENMDFYHRYAGRYRLVRIEIGGADCSETFTKGWEDRSMYMFLEITNDGRFSLRAHRGDAEKEYRYYFEPSEMKYYLKEDHIDAGTEIMIEDGMIYEEDDNHTMVYELTDELDWL